MTTTQTDELKFCPFCGDVDLQTSSNGSGEFMECNGCGASGPVATTVEEAYAVWNRRAAGNAAALTDEQILAAFPEHMGAVRLPAGWKEFAKNIERAINAQMNERDQ